MDDEKLREQVALFRHGVISEIISRTLSPGEQESLLTRIASAEWTIPGTSRTHVGRSTARDWMNLYRRCGFDGLKPGVRSDAGQSRSIPEEIQDQGFNLSPIQFPRSTPMGGFRTSLARTESRQFCLTDLTDPIQNCRVQSQRVNIRSQVLGQILKQDHFLTDLSQLADNGCRGQLSIGAVLFMPHQIMS